MRSRHYKIEYTKSWLLIVSFHSTTQFCCLELSLSNAKLVHGSVLVPLHRRCPLIIQSVGDVDFPRQVLCLQQVASWALKPLFTAWSPFLTLSPPLGDSGNRIIKHLGGSFFLDLPRMISLFNQLLYLWNNTIGPMDGVISKLQSNEKWESFLSNVTKAATEGFAIRLPGLSSVPLTRPLGVYDLNFKIYTLIPLPSAKINWGPSTLVCL